MRRMTPVATLLLAAFSFFGPPPAHSQQIEFANGFDSGRLCAWSDAQPSVQGCDTGSLLAYLESAVTQEEISAALRLGLESASGAGFIPSEVAAGLAEYSELVSYDPSEKQEAMTLDLVHQLASFGLSDAPDLPTVLPLLTSAVEDAFADPLAPQHRQIVLMFSAANPPTPPELPLSADSQVSLLGVYLYAEWIVNNFPYATKSCETDSSSLLCGYFVHGHQAGLMHQVLLRNLFAIVGRVALVIANVVAAAGTCPTVGVGETVLWLEDAITGCLIPPILEWASIEAPSTCISAPHTIEYPWHLDEVIGCVAAFAPCAGDLLGVALNAIEVRDVAIHTVNGVCTVVQNHEPVFDDCEQECPTGQAIKFGSPCDISQLHNCFDPLTTVPWAACESSTFSIWGKITHGCTTPLTGVRVELRDAGADGTLLGFDYSNSQGDYSFSNLELGAFEYTVVVQPPSNEYPLRFAGRCGGFLEDSEMNFSLPLWWDGLLWPPDDSTIQTVHPTLQWEQYPEADFYLLWLSGGGQSISEYVWDTSYYVSAPLVPGNIYYWNVRAFKECPGTCPIWNAELGASHGYFFDVAAP